MNEIEFIKKYNKIIKYKNIGKNEKNISTILLSFIIKKNSKILQIGNIDKNNENMIKNTIENPTYYVKMNDLNFNYNKLQIKKGFVFDTLIISYFKKTYEFCMSFSGIFKQIEYVFFNYNDKLKLCNAVRSPFYKQNFNSLLQSSYLIQKSNLGFLLNNTKIEYEIFRKGDIKGEIGKFIFSYGRDDLNKTSVINHLIYKYKFNNYLEIGVGDGLNYNKIKIHNKVGIDPNPSKECIENIYLMTSDEYFEYIENENLKFDIIFIDGLNLDYQVTKDIHNSLKHLSSNGYIILLNCNPLKKIYQRNIFAEGGVYLPWNGTTWKSYVNLRMNEHNLSMSVINTCWGMGIISRGKQKCYPKKDNLKFSDLNNDRLDILNLISIYEFLIKY
jgi:hypothetical protein